jgi:hypothetical protein
MTTPPESAPDPLWQEPVLDQFGTVVEDIWPEALQFVLECDRAPEHCRRRACRAAGGCRIRPVEGRKLSCGGATVDEETVIRASACALFGAMMVMRSLSWNASSPVPWLARADAD